MLVQKIDSFGGFGPRRYGTLKKIDEEETAFLEVSEDFFVGLPWGGDGESGEKIAREAGERTIGRVKKVGISFGRRRGEQEGLDMNGTEARSPFEAPQASSDVFGGGELAAAIAGEKCWDSHIQKW
jgi:hypothetical protein